MYLNITLLVFLGKLSNGTFSFRQEEASVHASFLELKTQELADG